MSYASTVLTVIALTYAGMAALALAIDRHHRQVFGEDAAQRTRNLMRVAGGSLLVLAIPPCVHLWGAGAGTVAWVGMLTIGALLSVGMLPYWPRRLAPSAAGAAALGLIGLGTLALG
jgi:hypothetical protein